MAESNRAIYAAISANLAIAITKFVAAGVTGSSAMFAEGLHSVVDTSDGALLLLGRNRSARPPDAEHPFGHAILIFAVGGGASILEGIAHLHNPEPPGDPLWNYIVLGAVAVGEGVDAATASEICVLAESDPAVARVNKPLTMHFGPNTILLAMEVEFRSGLPAGELTSAIDRIETLVHGRYPEIRNIFIEAESIGRHAREDGRAA